MNRTIKLTYAGAIVAVAIVVALLLVPNYAGASNGFEPCVPKDAYTETVVVTPAIPAIPATEGTPAIPGVPAVPAVTETIHHEAETHVVHHEAEPDLWWNWSPNHDQGPFEGPPAFPEDERGTWQGPHENGGPDQDTYGTFNSSNGENGRASWFHREKGEDAYDEVIVDVPAYDEVVVITPAIPAVPAVPAVPGTPAVPAVPAVTKDVFHPAVVCETPTVTTTVVPPVVTETVVPTPTPDDVQTPDVVEVPDKEETPVSTPNKDKPEPKPVYLIECVDGVFVTTVDGEVVSKNGSCVERDENDEPVAFNETGL